jgi:hypothetical protein
MLVHSTSSIRLTNLTLSLLYGDTHQDSWAGLIASCTALTYVYIESTREAEIEWLGRTLAKLAHAHHNLSSIQFPPMDYYSAKSMLSGLLDTSVATLDLSSIRTLVNAPYHCKDSMRNALNLLPCLATYANSYVFEPMCLPLLLYSSDESFPQAPAELVSLTIGRYNALTDAWLNPYLLSLTELTIVGTTCNLKGPLPRLRCLRLPIRGGGGGDGGLVLVDEKLSSFAPNLEQLALHVSTIWNNSDPRCDVLPCFTSLSRMPRLEHVELLSSYGPGWARITSTIVTLTLLTGILTSPAWRQITSCITPAPIYVDDSLYVAALPHVLWHVFQGRKHVGTYRPRVQASYWHSWVPGLCSKQVVWDLCLRV